jgi:hypothetical protein
MRRNTQAPGLPSMEEVPEADSSSSSATADRCILRHFPTELHVIPKCPPRQRGRKVRSADH